MSHDLPEGGGTNHITDHVEADPSAGVGPARQSGGPGVDPPGPRQAGQQRLTPLAPGQAEAIANGLRIYLQKRTFSSQECVDIALQLLGSFALDIAVDDRFKAATVIRRGSKALASQIEAGKFTVVRVKEVA